MRLPSIIQYRDQVNILTSQMESFTKVSKQAEGQSLVLDSSDDPVLSISIKSTEDYIQRTSAYQSNTTNAQNRTAEVTQAIQGSMDAISKVRELVTRGLNDTASATDRSNTARELEGVLKSILAFANTKDSTGSYIFSGTSTTTQPFVKSNGVYSYQGSMDSTNIDISQLVSVKYSDSGQNVFGNIPLGNGTFTINEGSTPNTGTAETSPGTVTSRVNYVEDTYTVTFVTNSNGRVGYQVVGANEGQVIPAPPLTTPADAPDYVSGDSIAFNGINFDITGAPDVGDTFVITPSTQQNAIETLRQLVTVMQSEINNPNDRARLHQNLTQLNSAVEQISAHLSNYLSDVAYRSLTIDNETTSNKNIITQQTIILKNLSYPEGSDVSLYSQLSQIQLNMQMTQTVYKKMSDLYSWLITSAF